MKHLVAWVCAAMLTAAAGPAAEAATPRTILVMAWQIDGILSLDPAEIFEFSGAEYAAQVYDRLVTFDVSDAATGTRAILPALAESWQVSADGLTFTFRLRRGITFHSGNPLTAQDAAYSLQRVVRLNKAPAFILTQFGFTPETVERTIRAPDDDTLVLTTDRPYAPGFVLSCLTAGVGAVVDRRLLQQHEENGDLGHGWLRTNAAGSGPFRLNAWRPNEVLVFDRFDGYWQGRPGLQRVFVRHIPEPGVQRLLLEAGDVDIARNLTNDQLQALRGHPRIRLVETPKGSLSYLGLNTRRAPFGHVAVRQALKYLVDYEGIRDSIMAGRAVVHQSFLPRGFPGAIDDTPFRLDVPRARQLLAEAGYPDGFTVTIDVRNVSPAIDLAQALQAGFAQAGVRLEILPADNRQTLTRYRARNHDIHLGEWGPDYQDPNTNAVAFASNPDNADGAASKTLAWRNAWDIPEMTGRTRAAMLERDPATRARMYEALQREHQQVSPFVILFQAIEVVAERNTVQGMIWGASFDDNRYWRATKE